MPAALFSLRAAARAALNYLLNHAVLARANRVVRPADFRTITRLGKRTSAQHIVVYVRGRETGLPSRFGFIVGKNVGGAVKRNMVRRRLRETGRELLRSESFARDIVVRALAGSAEISWATVQREIAIAIDRSVTRT